MKRILYKEIILVLGVSLLFSSMVFAGPNENAGIRFDLDATTYGNQNDTIMTIQGVGDYIRLDVYAINVHNFDTYEFEVDYNSNQLDYITASATNPITYEPNILTTNGGTAIGWMIDNSTPGILSIAYTLAGTYPLEAPEGEGLIADIVFQVSSTVGDTLTFGDVHYYDSFGVMDIIIDNDIAVIQGSVSVDDNGYNSQIEESRLYNYPNPVQNSASIEYSIKGMLISEEVEIDIYNMKGQIVDTVVGRNGESIWDTKDHPNGVYFYKLNAESVSEIKKMIVAHE